MKIKTAKDFGIIIHISRIRAGLTQAQLAAASGTGERFIRELEKGKATCQLEKALFVAQMLGIKLDAETPERDE
jgi:HTH-type transcriptional regulator/antitoxin HipB